MGKHLNITLKKKTIQFEQSHLHTIYLSCVPIFTYIYLKITFLQDFCKIIKTEQNYLFLPPHSQETIKHCNTFQYYILKKNVLNSNTKYTYIVCYHPDLLNQYCMSDKNCADQIVCLQFITKLCKYNFNHNKLETSTILNTQSVLILQDLFIIVLQKLQYNYKKKLNYRQNQDVVVKQKQFYMISKRSRQLQALFKKLQHKSGKNSYKQNILISVAQATQSTIFPFQT
eukprot:TRINITY_DN2480_c1_g1_i6.p1 TRINITY_DN2480_c1_g1~~TRINITY_DN2480_c1_g1_i6.p1  ORF type:complete len:228 (+),score=-25.83 TRINITY_DN2480_c1_g1_i6:221-904(+)